MLTPPDLSHDRIRSCLHGAYGLDIARAMFLPIGADAGSAVYRVTANDRTSYLLKLRRGAFRETSVTVPDFLRRRLGLDVVMAPLPTMRGELRVLADGFHWILYPFVDGVDGFRQELSDAQWVKLGAATRAIHRAPLPPALLAQIPREDYAPHARDLVRGFHVQIERRLDGDWVARRLTAFWQIHRREIETILDRAERLARALAERERAHVPCHADLHAGNVLVGADGKLFILDWDTLILAPKERDLMFIGGGVGGVWNGARDESLFYRGYKDPAIDHVALAYYRYERIVVDIAEACEQIFGARAGLDDRRELLRMTLDQFAPGNVIEIAHRTYRQIP